MGPPWDCDADAPARQRPLRPRLPISRHLRHVHCRPRAEAGSSTTAASGSREPQRMASGILHGPSASIHSSIASCPAVERTPDGMWRGSVILCIEWGEETAMRRLLQFEGEDEIIDAATEDADDTGTSPAPPLFDPSPTTTTQHHVAPVPMAESRLCLAPLLRQGAWLCAARELMISVTGRPPRLGRTALAVGPPDRAPPGCRSCLPGSTVTVHSWDQRSGGGAPRIRNSTWAPQGSGRVTYLGDGQRSRD